MAKNAFGFEEHGLQVGDKVRISGIERHDFELAAMLLKDGDITEVIETEMFMGQMPTLVVRATVDGMASHITGGRVPFADDNFTILTKVEEA